MKYLIALLLPLLGLSVQSYGQAKTPIMVIETTGSVKAKPKKGGFFKRTKLKSGSAVKEGSKLILGKNSSVLLLKDGQFERYDGKGKFVLQPTPEGTTRVARRNFDPLFGQFIESSYRITFSRIASGKWDVSTKRRGDGWGGSDPDGEGGWGGSDPDGEGGWGGSDPDGEGGWGGSDPDGEGGWGKNDPRNGDGWGVTPHAIGGWGGSDPDGEGGWGITAPNKLNGWGGSDPDGEGGWGGSDPDGEGGWGGSDPDGEGGWGTAQMNIQPLVPGGKYKSESIKASWLAQDGVDKYLVCVVDQDYNLVARQETKTNSAEVDLSNLSSDKMYYWQVFAHNKKSVSPPITFNIIDQEMEEEIQDMSSNSEIYSKAGPALQGMMQAVVYETTGMYKSGYDTYESLLAQYPGNGLLRMNFAAFCLRNGQYMKAKEIAEGM